MRLPVRALALGAACAAAVVSCSVPTDKSLDIQVGLRFSDTLQAHGVLGIGDRDSVFAYAFRVDGAGESEGIGGVGVPPDRPLRASGT